MIVIGAAGSRRRARMLMIAAAEWTPSRNVSPQETSTAGSPSLSTKRYQFFTDEILVLL
jgi:hypothetical protein